MGNFLCSAALPAKIAYMVCPMIPLIVRNPGQLRGTASGVLNIDLQEEIRQEIVVVDFRIPGKVGDSFAS